MHFLGIRHFCGAAGLVGSPFIAVGSSYGELYICHFNGRKLDIEYKLKGHEGAIIDVESSSRYVFSCDDYGKICVRTDDTYDEICSFANDDVPCSAIKARGNILAAGFDTGNIKLYNIR